MAVVDETTQTPEGDRAFHIEQHGIDHIDPGERWAKPRDLFGMWAGASLQIEYFVYGVILMTFGFTFAQAVAIIVLGNLSYLFLGLASLQGPQAGTTAMTINRASFGTRGSRLIALFNWLTQVGFETEGLILVVFAAEVLAVKAGFLPGTPAKVVFIVIAVAIHLLLPLLGHATMVKTLRLLIIPFVILFAILAALTLGKAHLNAVPHGAGWPLFMVGIAFTIAVAGLGWTENGNDYSRYLAPNAKKGSIVGWVFLGTAVPEILVMTLGAAVATYAPGLAAGDPFQVFTAPHVDVFATWFVIPFLIMSLLQLFAINSLDLYSSGVTLQALGVRVKRWQAVGIDTVIACGLTIYAVFDSSFSTLLKDFVDLVIIWIAPWFAIYLVDWALRRYRYAPAELQRTDRDGLYWGSGGIRWSAIVAQLLGMLAAIEALSSTFHIPTILNEITVHTHFADFSIFTGIFVAGLVYAVTAGPAVRREAARQDALLAA
jgi:nucleobase:cation symporter-1, NCS1 family